MGDSVSPSQATEPQAGYEGPGHGLGTGTDSGTQMENTFSLEDGLIRTSRPSLTLIPRCSS